LFDVAVQSHCSDELMQWSPTNGLREVVVHVDEDVVVLEASRRAVIPWIRHANHGGTLFDVAIQSRCSDKLMQWSSTNGLREVVVHVDVVILEVVGSARRASARACGTPFSFYQLHKWSTVGPPFKLVKILIDFQCGIDSLAFICGPFNS
jgi:hypothetical protein